MCLPVRPRHGRHIECGLHPALDLEAVDAGVDQIRNVSDHAEILGVKNIGSRAHFHRPEDIRPAGSPPSPHISSGRDGYRLPGWRPFR